MYLMKFNYVYEPEKGDVTTTDHKLTHGTARKNSNRTEEAQSKATSPRVLREMIAKLKLKMTVLLSIVQYNTRTPHPHPPQKKKKKKKKKKQWEQQYPTDRQKQNHRPRTDCIRSQRGFRNILLAESSP